MTMALGRSRSLVFFLALMGCFGTQLSAEETHYPVAQAKGQTVIIEPQHLRELKGSPSRHVTVRTDPALLRLPAFRQTKLAPELERLNQLIARGSAAGLTGILYENRDGGHSHIQAEKSIPQLTSVRYAAPMVARHQHYGLGGRFLFSLPTIGNSSTARTQGPKARSQSRSAIETDFAANRAYTQYVSNHLYVYPEHRDHDPEHGDKFFANTPYVLTSQGSSGSDRPFLRAIFAIIAALTPETRLVTEQTGQMSPTIQMVLRRTMEGVDTDEDYMSGPAHPSAFDGKKIDRARAIALAHSLTPASLPPQVILSVEKDLQASPGIDYLEAARSEAVFTTPSAISRVWRSYAFEREMVLSADTSVEDLSVSFHWRLLRGDPAKVSITPSNDGRSARIKVAWHDAFSVPGTENLKTSRVDIGVFADNGTLLSAPAFLSIAFPTHQQRRYEEGPKGGRRLSTLSYIKKSGTYVDPMIWPVAAWRDHLLYSPEGTFVGIERHYQGGQVITHDYSSSSRISGGTTGPASSPSTTSTTTDQGVFVLQDAQTLSVSQYGSKHTAD